MSTIERLAAFLDGTEEHPETGKRFHEYADEALAQKPKRYYWWRKYVRQMRAQAASEYAELEQRAVKAEKAVVVYVDTLNAVSKEKEAAINRAAELERRNAELVEALSLAMRLFIKYEMAVDEPATGEHRAAMRVIDAALAHSAQEKAHAEREWGADQASGGLV